MKANIYWNIPVERKIIDVTNNVLNVKHIVKRILVIKAITEPPIIEIKNKIYIYKVLILKLLSSIIKVI